MNKFKILLIDGWADGITTAGQVSINATLYQPAPEKFGFEGNVEIAWLRTPQECRAFFDLFRRLEVENADNLSEVVPDIILVNYSLTGDYGCSTPYEVKIDEIMKVALNDEIKELKGKTEDEERLENIKTSIEERTAEIKQRFCPLYSLRKKAKDLRIPDEIIRETEFSEDNPGTLAEDYWYETGRRDDMGAQSGLVIYSLFSTRYPTAIIPYTVRGYDSTKDGHIAYLEYMFKIEGESEEGVFSNKYIDMTNAYAFRSLFQRGIKIFRKRAAQLAINGQVYFDFSKLLELAHGDATEIKGEDTILLKSTYGERLLPLRGLFVDSNFKRLGQHNKEEIKEINLLQRDEAKKWASEIVAGTLNKCSPDQKIEQAIEDLRTGYEYSEKLIEAYFNMKYRKERYWLSKLLSDLIGCLAEYDDDELTNRLNGVKTVAADHKLCYNYLLDSVRKLVLQNGSLNKYCWRRQLDKIKANLERLPKDEPITTPDCMQPENMRSINDVTNDHAKRWTLLFTYARWLKFFALESGIDDFEKAREEFSALPESSERGSSSKKKYILADVLFPLPDHPLLPWEENGIRDLTHHSTVRIQADFPFKSANDLFNDLIGEKTTKSGGKKTTKNGGKKTTKNGVKKEELELARQIYEGKEWTF